MNLMAANCPRCGRLYNKGFGDVCGMCRQEIEKQYEACLHYLRKNKGCNIYELSEATEVPVKQITKFVREGRISIVDAPNMGIPCEVCGTLIHSGTMCDNCRNRLTKDMQRMTTGQARSSDAQEAAQPVNYNIRQNKE
ncbi:flagellar protein [Marinicrinis lubricantis]|uniref:Flagellar protein n=1 Tax=Marinicrinis lubricantis TaxID=2086470 RepID=A0ABW1ISX4_9BACL